MLQIKDKYSTNHILNGPGSANQKGLAITAYPVTANPDSKIAGPAIKAVSAPAREYFRLTRH